MRRAWLLVACVVLALLIVAQLALPGIAARRLASDLRGHGSDVHVEVSALPAIELLWHSADRVTATIADYRPGQAGSGTSLGDLLARTSAVDRLDVRVGTVEERLLRMHDVRLHKVGDVLTGQVGLVRGEVDAALPRHLRVAAHTLPDGELAVAGQTRVFGTNLAARARIAVDRGRIVLRPDGIPLASLVAVPIFSDKRVAVDAIGAQPTPDGFRVTARAHLTG
ncbi:MAG: hypothetical protein QOC78_3201 [Solirubrobacteraceae bacterium]|jgi:hypothetical protein|nr:hypothetical protein [Solirubrobacteraceae bacterium]